MQTAHYSDDVEVTALDALFGIAPLLSAQMQAGLSERNLSLSRAALLWEVAKREPVIQRELAAILQVVPRTVTGIIDDLATAGLLQRSPHPKDRRAFEISLTDEGHGLIATLRRERRELAVQLCAGIDHADLQAMARVIGLITHRLSAIDGGYPTTKETS
jgi:DNA-binding MarR family transcriptional regulator